MDLSPDNEHRCDSKLCQYATACNLITLFLILVFISGLAQANMSLDRMVVDFRPDDAHHKDVQVFNKDKNNIFVNISVEEVLKPGTPQEQRVPVKDVKKIALVATPQKLIVPGNSQKAVRLVTLEDSGKTDRIFRVTFSPAVGKLKAKTSGIKLLIAYQTLVIVRPDKPVANVIAERKGKKIIFRNTGNTNVMLQNGMQCNPSAKKQCEKFDTQRLYAGNTWELTLPYDAPVTFDLDDGAKVLNRTFGEVKPAITSR